MLRDLRKIKPSTPVVEKENLNDFKVSQEIKSRLNQLLGPADFSFNDYTSFAITDKATNDVPANYALIPNQYLIYACKLFPLATELFKYIQIFEQLRNRRQLLLGSSSEIEQRLDSDEFSDYFESSDDRSLFAKFMDRDNNEFRLGAKRLINDNGTPRGGKDCFSSVVLKVANLPDSSSSIFGALVYELCKEPTTFQTLRAEFDEHSSSKESLSLPLSNGVIREFIFAVIKHLAEYSDLDRLFNHLVPIQDGQRLKLTSSSSHISSFFKVSDQELHDEDLSTGGTLRWFNKPIEHNNQFYYLTNQWTDTPEDHNHRDINNFKVIFEEIYPKYEIEIRNNSRYTLKLRSEENHVGIRVNKPFILLAGISGTGKTRFVREQASKTNQLTERYQLIPVRPDWHEPSDLLGYVSRLGQAKHYVVTDVLKFVVKAWKSTIDNGLTYQEDNSQTRPQLVGTRSGIEKLPPFWLCLDEMNLAPVEQYFADYLSVIETRHWNWSGDSFEYETDALLSPTVVQQLDPTQQMALRKELSLDDRLYDELWTCFHKYGIGIPPNLIVAGTVNMDETTHGFSRKVIDRALTFDFGEFFPNNFDEFFAPTTANKALSFPIYSHVSLKQLPAVDNGGRLSIDFLRKVNEVLGDSPFQLAYRALNELLLSVVCSSPQTKLELKAVWDDFLMTKVLPRIEGDADKLNSRSEDQSLLTDLMKLLQQEFSEFWDASPQNESPRPDLFREKVSETNSRELVFIPCRSKKKLAWMQERLKTFGFASFWP